MIVVASIVVTAAGLAWMRLEESWDRASVLRAAAIDGKPPPFDSSVWAVEEEAPLDRWSSWQMSTYKPSKGVTCWRFLVLPRGASPGVAFKESVGTSACSPDRSQRYSVHPKTRACQWIGSVPPWRDRFVGGDEVAKAACATAA